jgi:hypothetical protein
MTDHKDAHSAGSLKFHFYEHDYRVQIQNVDLWKVNNQKLTTTVFPAGDWTSVRIFWDSTDSLNFEVFKLTLGNRVFDFVAREKCGSIWFDNRDMVGTDKINYPCYDVTAKNYREYASENHHPLCTEGFQQVSLFPRQEYSISYTKVLIKK